MNYDNINDNELVSMVAENEEATSILFNKYKPLIHSLAIKYYHKYNPPGLELNDLIQEGMVGFSMAINTYHEKKDTMFFTYATTCIKRKIISQLVATGRQKNRILNDSISMEALNDKETLNSLDRIIGDTSRNPEVIIVDNENTTEILEYLNKELTDFESQIFELKKSGFTYKEIADILDIAPKKVDNAIQRIKNKIKSYKAK